MCRSCLRQFVILNFGVVLLTVGIKFFYEAAWWKVIGHFFFQEPKREELFKGSHMLVSLL